MCIRDRYQRRVRGGFLRIMEDRAEWPGIFSGKRLHNRFEVAPNYARVLSSAQLQKCIGRGTFSRIWSARDIEEGGEVAIKIENTDQGWALLKWESEVLQKMQDSKQVCRWIHFGSYEAYNTLAMQLLRNNMSEVRKLQPQTKYSVQEAAELCIRMLGSIEDMHKLGYVHRDIKPSNFAVDNNSAVYILDFGLCRKYLDNAGNMKEAREFAHFRGTSRYASPNAHDCHDLGRVDDLWSLFYLLVEFVTGVLPWFNERADKAKIKRMKLALTDDMKNRPEEYMDAIGQFVDHLTSLSYDDTPDYDALRRILTDISKSTRGPVPSTYHDNLPQAVESIGMARASSAPSLVLPPPPPPDEPIETDPLVLAWKAVCRDWLETGTCSNKDHYVDLEMMAPNVKNHPPSECGKGQVCINHLRGNCKAQHSGKCPYRHMNKLPFGSPAVPLPRAIPENAPWRMHLPPPSGGFGFQPNNRGQPTGHWALPLPAHVPPTAQYPAASQPRSNQPRSTGFDAQPYHKHDPQPYHKYRPEYPEQTPAKPTLFELKDAVYFGLLEHQPPDLDQDELKKTVTGILSERCLEKGALFFRNKLCLLYTSPSPRDS
eukprot:TRINITY_DN27484_c0_g1_i5.p1 TRINITY_DN27484_c0_g1~~TRINITY_DN27484_c0_g1_i5.p1  ORF type:complete len:599 (+),score=132.47 TRINITY_DN27484_c0_g1_i5:175-1971(+)